MWLTRQQKVSLAGILGGHEVVKINTGVGWRIPTECVSPEMPNEKIHLVQFIFSAD